MTERDQIQENMGSLAQESSQSRPLVQRLHVVQVTGAAPDFIALQGLHRSTT